MRTHVFTLLTAFAAIVLPRIVTADPQKGPDRPDPEKWFQVLDKNHDGQLSSEELPPMLKEHAELLKKADANHDSKLSKDEFVKALGQMKEIFQRHRMEGHQGVPPQSAQGRPGAPEAFAHRHPGADRPPMSPRSHGSMADRGPGPQPPPPPTADQSHHGKHATKDKHHKHEGKKHGKKHRHAKPAEGSSSQDYARHCPRHPGFQGPPTGPQFGREFAGRRPDAPWARGPAFGSGCPYAGRQPRSHMQPGPAGQHRAGPGRSHAQRPPMPPSPRDVFARLDRNHDGVLSFEEFARGMAMFHQRMQRMQQGGRPPLPSWHPPIHGDRQLPPGHPPVSRERHGRSQNQDRHVGPSHSHGHSPAPQCGPNCPGCPKCPMSPKGESGHPPVPPQKDKKA